jgi:MFS family permease
LRPSPASAGSRYFDLLIYRGIGGIGLGGEFGIGMALVAEAWPASKRACVSSYVGPGWQAGVLAAALITPLLLLIGWRGMFGLGVVPAIAAYVIRASLHEPEMFVGEVQRPSKRVRLAPAGEGRRDRKTQPQPGDPQFGCRILPITA